MRRDDESKTLFRQRKDEREAYETGHRDGMSAGIWSALAGAALIYWITTLVA